MGGDSIGESGIEEAVESANKWGLITDTVERDIAIWAIDPDSEEDLTEGKNYEVVGAFHVKVVALEVSTSVVFDDPDDPKNSHDEVFGMAEVTVAILNYTPSQSHPDWVSRLRGYVLIRLRKWTKYEDDWNFSGGDTYVDCEVDPPEELPEPYLIRGVALLGMDFSPDLKYPDPRYYSTHLLDHSNNKCEYIPARSDIATNGTKYRSWVQLFDPDDGSLGIVEGPTMTYHALQ